MPKRYSIPVSVFGVLFAILGLRWMFGPEAAAIELGITLGDAVAFNTARGDLGGMFVAAAILCVMGVVKSEPRYLEAVAVVVGCIAIGRTVGLVLDGFARDSFSPLVVEVVMVTVLLLAARSTSEERLQPTASQ